MSNNIKSDKLLIRARRSELIDAQNVVKLVNDATKELFGPKIKEVGKIIELIEKAVLSITIENEQDDALMAMACFYDRPNVYGVAPSAWEDWLKKMYEADKNTSLNTLFLHFFAAHSKFNIASLHEVIKSAFRAVPECHYVVLCVPQDSVPDVSMGSVFVPMKKRHVDDVNLLLKHQYTVYMTSREKHIPVLHIRDANVNDNDDLVPLFNSYTDQLKATYGDYYVAEMIEAQNENNKCLTAEAEGFGMGFMAITNDVNVSFLNECFELRPFHGLCKPHPDDLLIEPPSQRPKSSKHPTPEVKHKLSDAGLMDMTDVDQILGDDDGNMSTKSSSKSRPSNAHSTLQGSVSGESRFIPTYVGTPNAFSIQLFCIEEKYESRSLDFLPRAFEKFPDKDYCIITLPPNVPEFGLIQNFVRVTPRDTNKVNQELYLFHRGGLSESFEVREATRMSDFVAVEKLVQNLKSKAAILSDLKLFMRSRKEPTGVDVQAYVAQSMGRTVGVAIIRQEEDIEYLRSRYNIDDFIHFTHHKREEHGHLNHFALMPTFSYLTKFFVKEVLRKSNKTCLYYPIYPEYAPDDIAQKYSLITAMNYMVPVRARPQIEYNHARLGINAPSEHVLRPRYDYFLPCALNHINLKLIYEPKISINMRIVVVGASDLAISFLETLVMSQHLRFNNLTLVSTCGMPGMLSPDQFREGFAAQNMNYDSADHANLSLRSWINVIMGQLTAIDRRHKQITIDNARVISYDHLILATGEQYYYIAPMQNRVENAYTKKEIKPHLNRPMFDSLPFNMFVVNNEFEAEYLLTYLTRNHLVDSDETILIYGYDINVICSIQSLIKFGVDPKRIKVFCQREAAKACIHDPHVNTKLREVLRKLEIQIFESYQMEEWNEGHWKSGDPIDSIYFKKLKNDDLKESPRSMNVKCCALLCFYKKDVDYKIFMAANSSHLVYDGRLVIDTDFHTNDSCIRAAGKMTKYKRSYYVDSWSHACFNQKEIGVDLAQKMLKLVDPTMIVNESDEDGRTDSHRLATNEPDAKVLIPLYEKPLISYAYFPGDYFYLHVTKPGLPTPYEEEKKEGTELKTETENGYFRIHLNKNKCVQTITCFSKKNFSALNFSKIYGMHEQYLNKLLLKYEQKLVPDFYKYFSENWTTAIYHDRFQELRREIRDLSLNPDNGFKSVNDLLREQVDKDLILTRDQRATASEYFGQSNTRKLVEKRVLSYLNYNYNHLPMYVKPDMV